MAEPSECPRGCKQCIARLRERAAEHGLHLVTEADKAVLDAIRDLKIVRCVGQLMFSDSRENELCEAEVAARVVR